MSEGYAFPSETVALVESNLREVQDFPAPGVLFRDITPLIADPEGFQALIGILADRYRGKVDAVAGLESRGFILAAPLAIALGVGMVTIRKAGRLPGPVVGVDYDGGGRPAGSDSRRRPGHRWNRQRGLRVDRTVRRCSGGTLRPHRAGRPGRARQAHRPRGRGDTDVLIRREFPRENIRFLSWTAGGHTSACGLLPYQDNDRRYDGHRKVEGER